VLSSVDIINKTRGGDWPTSDLSFEDDMICLYLYPVGFRKEAPEGSDVDVSFWVTQKAYDQGLYEELYTTLKEWIKVWPFKKPFWSSVVSNLGLI